MTDPTRRQVIKFGAAGALLLPIQWTAAAHAASAAPPEVRAVDDLALWYDEPASADWLRALPIGNGRFGAMVFGNVDTERLQLNEDTLWAGGPHDYSNPAGAAALPGIQRLVFEDQWAQAQDLINRQSGLAMDVWQASTDDGTPISQWTYTGNPNQQFNLQRA